MAPRNSLIDNDFIDENDFEEKPGQQEEKWTPPEPQELARPGAAKPEDQIAVEIGDDTPEEDRGKWVADDAKDGEPEIPGEEEVRGYAKGAQRRIGQMTARIHAERRRADEIAREHNEAVNLARRLMAENNSLKDFVNQGQKVLMGEHRGRLQGVVDAAKAAYKEAHDAGDAAGMIAAQEQLASAIAKMERAAATQPMNLQREDETIFQRPLSGQPPAPPAAPDPEAVKWHKKNGWFGRDDAMTGYALGLHKQMIERDGVTPDQPEYYRTLDQEMRKRFPDRFQRSNGGGERRQQTPVGAATRSGNGGGAPRTVRITESQARLAQRLGLTVQQYAQQLVDEERQRGSDGQRSFTHG